MEAIYEHLHLIGKTCKLWAELPDHTVRPLIKINDWDFNWQSTYHVKERIRLPKGTILHAEWTHDNTAENIHNPNHPPKRVTYGENSTDEMVGALINVYVDSERDNGILWIANLVHLGKASTAPSRRPANEKKFPSVGLMLIGAEYEGLGNALIGLIEAPLRTLGMFLILLAVTPLLALLALTRLFPNPSRQVADKLNGAPLRSFETGLLLLGVLAVLGLPLLFAENAAAQICSVLLWLGAMAAILLGMTGLALSTSKRLSGPQGDDASFAALTKSSLLLTLAFAFPVLGWFILAPFTMTAALGAGAITLWTIGREHLSLLRSNRNPPVYQNTFDQG